MKAYNDPQWEQTSREVWRSEGIELTSAEVEAEGIPATFCGNCGATDDEPEPAGEEEDHCEKCGEDGYICTGYLVRRCNVGYFLGHA